MDCTSTGKRPGLLLQNQNSLSYIENLAFQLQALSMLRTPIKIEACAVWDTVSALGIPVPFGIPSVAYNKLVFVEAFQQHEQKLFGPSKSGSLFNKDGVHGTEDVDEWLTDDEA